MKIFKNPKKSILAPLCAATLLFCGGQTWGTVEEEVLRELLAEQYTVSQAAKDWQEMAYDIMEEIRYEQEIIDNPFYTPTSKSEMPLLLKGCRKDYFERRKQAPAFIDSWSINFKANSSINKENINEFDKHDLITIIHEMAHFFLGHTTKRSNLSSEQMEFEAEDLTMQALDKLGRYDLIGIHLISRFIFRNTELVTRNIKKTGLMNKYFLGALNGLSRFTKKKKAQLLMRFDSARKELCQNRFTLASTKIANIKRYTLARKWKPQGNYDDAIKQLEKLLEKRLKAWRL